MDPRVRAGPDPFQILLLGKALFAPQVGQAWRQHNSEYILSFPAQYRPTFSGVWPQVFNLRIAVLRRLWLFLQ
jgi:hypothetical protein